MKKLLKLTTLLLLVTMTFNLIACSSFGKIQNALEDIGYALIQGEENEASQEAKDDERATKVYMFTNKDSLSGISLVNTTLVTVIEFKSTEDMVEYYKESETAQGIIDDIQEDGTAEEIYNQLKVEGIACGNCIIVPLGADFRNVLNAIKELNK